MTIRHALVPAYLAACLLLGGASAAGFAANMVLQLAALPIICVALWSLIFAPPPNLNRAPLIFFGICLVFMALQLLPLPPELWTALPGRAPVADGLRLLQVPLPWLPLSLDPAGTLASLLWLLPAIATLLGVVVLGAFRGSLLSWSLLVVTVLSIAVGALQLAGGKVGGAYIYEITNYGVAVGFFANGNHMATLLLVAIPFLGALQLSLLRRARSPRNASAVRVLTATIFVVLIVGLLTNLSLAGLGLSVPVVLVSFLSFRRKDIKPRWWIFAVALLLSVAAVATVVLGPFGNNLVGSQQHNAELSRRTSFQLTLNAAREYLPFGSGVGTFQEVYRTQEPLKSVTTVYMNHAHSDWLELLLETGLLGIGLAAIFLLWWAARVRAIWTATGPDYYARAAAIATGTILLHSLVDYPLRTAAISAVFAMCAGLMSDARPFTRRQAASASTRHVTI
ncbi:O-antigen ligase family protein [Sphingomonas sp.]|jgi:O-antigen ligase|uniref:O-antigen ligase family protein n=1 Tax=Sphingomonas sp. TaxID=28214 RepID=UPI002D7FA8F5|nr:O-antigen ligase family protein [Sphingomonas sp.]HEU0044544.1 O-antigen ligase family protein [Sphingomonas sp.]